MLLCGIDLETSGLDKGKDHITEIAWTIKRHGVERSLVDRRHYVQGATEIPEEVIKLTHIKPDHCRLLSVSDFSRKHQRI